MDIIWHPNTAIENIVWPNCEGAINGFTDKEEIISKIKNPMEDLAAIIFVTENYMTQNYYPEDILSIELHNPKWKIEEQFKGFQENSEKENVLKCNIGAGTMIKISPDANEWDRFCEGHSDIIDMKEGVYIFTLFERIIENPDIVYIKLVYDKDYWEWFEQRGPYEGLINSEYPKKYLQFVVPWHLDECKVPIDYSDYGIDDNPLQKGYVDESGALNISWRCPNREKGLCDCKIV